MDAVRAKAHVKESSVFQYTSKDAILYALGIGARVKDDLHFLYENHDTFEVFPTFVVVPAFAASSIGDWPGITFDLSKILHGEHYMELFEQPPPDGAELHSVTRLADIVDKGSGAVILVDVTTHDARTGRKIAYQQFGVLQLGAGNFGGERKSVKEVKAIPVPTRVPDMVVEERIAESQAALYRLGSGDYNPLHIDSGFARLSGFDRPILHGLCTLGFAVRAVLLHYGANHADNFVRLKVRFSSPVLPGNTLLTEMWEEGTRIHFQSKVKETGKVVLSNAYVDIKEMGAPGGSERLIVTSGGNAPIGSMKTMKGLDTLAKSTSNSSLTNDEMRSKL